MGAGDLWYDSGTNNLKVYNGSAWVIFIANYNTDNLTRRLNQPVLHQRTRRSLPRWRRINASLRVWHGVWRMERQFSNRPSHAGYRPRRHWRRYRHCSDQGQPASRWDDHNGKQCHLSVADLNITVANGAANAAAANSAGLTVDGATQHSLTTRPATHSLFNKNVTATPQHWRQQTRPPPRHRARLVGKANGKHIQKRTLANVGTGYTIIYTASSVTTVILGMSLCNVTGDNSCQRPDATVASTQTLDVCSLMYPSRQAPRSKFSLARNTSLKTLTTSK